MRATSGTSRTDSVSCSSSVRWEPTNAAAISPDGSEIATASADGLARIYYSQDGRVLAPLAGHRDAVTSIAFDSSGRTIVTGSADGTARLWDALPEGTLEPIDQRKTAVQAFWVGNDAVSVSGRQARILSTSGRVLRTVTLPGPITATAANGRFVALADATGDLTIASRTTSTPSEHLRGVTALAYAGTLLFGFDRQCRRRQAPSSHSRARARPRCRRRSLPRAPSG